MRQRVLLRSGTGRGVDAASIFPVRRDHKQGESMAILRRAHRARTCLLVVSAVQGLTLALLAGRPLLAQPCEPARATAPALLPARGVSPSLLGYPPTCATRFALTATTTG